MTDEAPTCPGGALQGVRILDLTRILAGPFCSMLLADMGAEVIKIEEPGKGDDTRSYPPFLRGASAYFANINRNKKSITLDLKKEEGKEVFRKLLKKADVLLENFKPGTMEKLGLGYDQAKTLNPGIIYASISGFGQYGPYKDKPGYDIIGQAMGGLMSTTGWPDSPPTRTGTAMADVLAGLNTCIGVLASLRGREQTGQGERVDVALVDSVVSAMETILQIYLVRTDARHGSAIVTNSWPLTILFPPPTGGSSSAAAAIRVWKRFCEAIGREDLLTDSSLHTNVDRVREHERLNKIVTAWTSQRKVADIVSHLTLQHPLFADLRHRSGVQRFPHRRSQGDDCGNGPSPRREDEGHLLSHQIYQPKSDHPHHGAPLG